MIICITGTPGTGKTRVSHELSKLLYKKLKSRFKVLHLNDVILSRRFWTSEDKKRKSKNADMRRLGSLILTESKRHHNLIVESHLAHHFKADIIFVLRTKIPELKKRMKKRGWGKDKVEENLEAERLNLILGESFDIHGRKRCFEIDTTGKGPIEVADEIFAVLNKNQE